ncbi:hypothetical protein D3C85_1565370 [compost metagenome]
MPLSQTQRLLADCHIRAHRMSAAFRAFVLDHGIGQSARITLLADMEPILRIGPAYKRRIGKRQGHDRAFRPDCAQQRPDEGICPTVDSSHSAQSRADKNGIAFGDAHLTKRRNQIV